MFICKYCEEEFNNAKELKQHEKCCDCNPTNNSHENYVCRNCCKSFSTKDELVKHMRNCNSND